jgi:hypothetical protein
MLSSTFRYRFTIRLVCLPSAEGYSKPDPTKPMSSWLALCLEEDNSDHKLPRMWGAVRPFGDLS